VQPDVTIHRTLGHGFDWRSDGVEWPVTTDVGEGLSGVIAGETRVMWLDPSSGLVTYRGVAIEELAATHGFEQVAHLLITGTDAVQGGEEFASFRAQLRAAGRLPGDVVGLVRDLDPGTHPTRMLRAGVSALGCHEASVEDDLAGERHWQEVRVVGQVAALLAEICRHRQGLGRASVSGQASPAEWVLTALNDRSPTAEDVRALDLLWVLYAAHGFDAPTFTSVVVASCRADPYTNLVAGLSALRGRHQGGASERVLDQRLVLDGPDEAERWVRSTVAGGGVVAGFGHRVYRMPDPRAAILRSAAARFARRTGRGRLFEVARAVEGEATRLLAPKGVHVNINFYGAVLFHLLGADPPLGPCLFAVARMAGMVALVREALDTMRLYRPLSRYVGVAQRSLDDRGES